MMIRNTLAVPTRDVPTKANTKGTVLSTLMICQMITLAQ